MCDLRTTQNQIPLHSHDSSLQLSISYTAVHRELTATKTKELLQDLITTAPSLTAMRGV